MSHVLGPYCSFWHWRAEDEQYIHQLDPAWTRIHQPTAKAIHVVQSNAPNANIMLRSWDVDDSNGERKREMYADPKGAAHKHLAMWKTKWEELETELKRNGWDYDTNRWYLGLVNEPDPAYVPQVVEYSLEAMRLIEYRDIRLGLVCSSVGNFSKPSENDRGWTKFMPLEKPINDGGHILIAHEYWQPEGPRFGEDAGNLAWRHRSIPLDVPILIGEAGANGYIYGRHSQNDDAGWRKFMEPDQYAAQVKEYIEGCDQRVKGVLLYMLDFHSDQWWSFDTQPAMHQLLAIKDARPQQPSPFGSKNATPPPSAPESSIFFVNVPSGANVRSAPSTDANPPLATIPYGSQLTVTGGTPTREWVTVNWEGKKGWVLASLLSVSPPQPVPIVTPAGDNWARSLAFVRRWEGQWADDPNDPGGATMKGITLGTYNRWRAAHGQPQPTKAELRAISDEESGRIFYEWYWLESGADKLPWPMCLAAMNIAVNGGPERAKQFLNESGGNFILFAAIALEWYSRLDGWHYFGAAWTRRTADMLREGAR
jgi:hypothetical protein